MHARIHVLGAMEHELKYASVHEYARTKALGEAAVLEVGVDSLGLSPCSAVGTTHLVAT